MMTTEEYTLHSQQTATPLLDNIGITQSSGLDYHAVFNRQRVDQFVEQDVASTESARQHKDATDLICQPDTEQRQLIRRLTPLECERLQGFPDGWTDIPGASDSARYKALGNSVAIPCVTFVLRGIAAVLRETVSW
jgi:DNA (cytosine-5)-methyltransferase 1